jgi:hypothetical protein
MSNPVPCGMCGGSGKSRLCPIATCQRCQGSGTDPYANDAETRVLLGATCRAPRRSSWPRQLTGAQRPSIPAHITAIPGQPGDAIPIREP